MATLEDRHTLHRTRRLVTWLDAEFASTFRQYRGDAEVVHVTTLAEASAAVVGQPLALLVFSLSEGRSMSMLAHVRSLRRVTPRLSMVCGVPPRPNLGADAVRIIRSGLVHILFGSPEAILGEIEGITRST